MPQTWSQHDSAALLGGVGLIVPCHMGRHQGAKEPPAKEPPGGRAPRHGRRTGRARTLPGQVSATALLALTPQPSAAQTVVEIDDRVACATCVIEVGPPLALALPADRFSFTTLPGSEIARDSEGNYIAAPVEGDALVVVFGPDGSYMSSYGRMGPGPGQFASDVPLLMEVGDGDVLYAIDLLQLHTLAPRAARSLDQVRMPVQAADAVVLKDGRIAVQAAVRSELGNTTIRILRPDGTIEASIGASETTAHPGRRGMDRRVLGRSNDRADVWSAHVNRYRLIRYAPDGSERARIERASEWFRPYTDRTPGAPFRAPADPRVVDIRQDADGLLWVAIGRAPASFSPTIDDSGPVGAEAALSPYFDLNQVLHTTVEVVDPVAGEVVARREFDEYLKFVNTAGDEVFMYSRRPDALGRLDCIVARLWLRREQI